MMLDEPNNHHYLPHRHNNLSLDVPPWPPSSSSSPSSSCYDADPQLHSPSFFALSRFLPSNVDPYEGCEEEELNDLYSSDEFRMYDFKVRRCTRGRSHDWTECPYAHPGEKARRRDPHKYHYSGVACPDFRKGSCKKGDSCEFAHGVFECWLHPTRYRTQPCKDGINCRRRVCFFAHTPEQLRVVPPSGGSQQSPRALASDAYDGSPARHHQHLQTPLEAFFPKSILMSSSSPTSTLVSPPLSPPAASPPLSPSQPTMRRSPGGTHMNDVLASLRQLHLSKWGSPRGAATMMNTGFCGLPAVVSRRGGPASPAAPPCMLFDTWDEPVERVESGRDLRARIAEKLSKENGLERSEDEAAVAAAPDVGWVSDLLN